MMLWLHMLLYV